MATYSIHVHDTDREAGPYATLNDAERAVPEVCAGATGVYTIWSRPDVPVVGAGKGTFVSEHPCPRANA
jgi:hypothetical protein